jgi:hypothetical protein
VTEGNAGTVNAVFTVTKTLESSQTATVDFTTGGGTATAGTDYVANSNTLTFLPGGGLTQTITVDVAGDLVDEVDETFNVTLSNPTGGATISDATGLGTITDDDQSTLAIDDVTVTEGNAGTVNAVFTVTKTLQSSQNVSVDYATGGGTATPGTDYTANTNTLTFLPGGGLTQTITVVVTSDQVDEVDETFNLTLSNPTGGAAITDNTGLGTVTDDDTNGIAVDHLDGTTSVVESIGPTNADSVSVVLTAEPVGTVVVDVTSADTGEFTVGASDAQLTFTSLDWDVPRIVSIFGVEDSVVDGNQLILLIVSVNDGMSDDAWDSVSDATHAVTVVDID